MREATVRMCARGAGRRGLLLGALALVAGSGRSRPREVEPEAVVDLDQRPELLLHDGAVVAASEGVALEMARVEKHPAPILEADRPWEVGFLGYACVLYDVTDGLYKMWYETRADEMHGRCLYAVSRDGLRWDKPNAGVVEFKGSRANNIVFTGPPDVQSKVHWVIKDYADPDPGRRYKMMYHLWDHGGRGVSIAHSPDGIHWTGSPFVNLHGGFDTQNLMFWDERVGAFVGYFRLWEGGHRQIGRSESPDGYHWGRPRRVHGPDARDPEKFDLYTPAVFKYRAARDVYVMVPAAFDWPTNTLFGQLALSRDGVAWYRFREPFLPLGAKGSWDSGSIYPVPSDVTVGGRTAIYYRGNDYGHGAQGRTAYGVAFLRKGGFVARRAAGEGTLTTRPLNLRNERYVLYLDADGRGGSIRAELLDGRGRVFEGYSRADSDEIRIEGNRLLLRWRGSHDLPAAARAAPFRLKLYLRAARVYGIENAPPPKVS